MFKDYADTYCDQSKGTRRRGFRAGGVGCLGDEARTRMAPDASSRGWKKAFYSEAALRRRDLDLLELLKEGEDLGVVLVLRELELGLGVDVRLQLLGVVANA